MGELDQTETGIFDQIGFLSFLTGPDTAAPGSTHTFEPKVEMTETVDTEGLVKIIEIYKC